MPQRPTFQRSPRFYPEMPAGEVEIPAPPQAPGKPQIQLVTVLLPGALAVGMLVATVVTASATGNILLTLFSFSFMIVSSLVSVLSYVSQSSGHRRALAERERRYRALLQGRRDQLSALRAKQSQASLETDPEPPECLRRVEERDSRLWERGPADSDFLALRLGLGQQPFRVAVKPPQRDETQEPDPLVLAALQLKTDFAMVDGVPIQLPLGQAGVAGLVGRRSQVCEAARALLVQLATHHSPEEVRIVAVFPADELAEWQWLRWLPHTWTDDRQHRFLACEADAAHALLGSLYDLLMRRRLAAAPAQAQPLPAYVFLLADPALAQSEPILPLLFREGAALGAFTLVTADDVPALPKDCQAVVDLAAGRGTLTLAGQVARSAPFTPDALPVDLADRLARAMAPIRLRRAAPRDIPATVPLLDLLGVEAVEDLDVKARWAASQPFRTLAVPIGLRVGAEPVLLDLHERGHGPHGLVAGTTGSGKSELLLSLVASLAVHFHPHELALVLIDYKGGGTANAVADLPHLVGTITNLQGNLATRALAAIKSESQRRQALLAQAGVNHIDAYQQRFRQGALAEPMPHLVIMADEFAELATEQPEFMKELISAVRVGRSLGLHLILATQKPAGVVNEQIWSNARFRICLRVEQDADSMDVLKRPDAAGLPSTSRGRAYLQVGMNEVFELFQAAWGGAPYTPGGYAAADPCEVLELPLDGSRRPLRLSPRPLAVQARGTQLEALVGYLRDQAEAAGVRRLRGPWLPPLPETLTLDEVRPASGWDGRSWQPTPTWLEPVVGQVDNPAQQEQAPLALNLGKEGHLAIYGAPGSGKTTLLQTLILSLALAHSPEEVQLYLLDFGGRMLSAFAPLPHVGGVVLADEEERVWRLCRHLRRELEERKEQLSRAGAQTLADYRRATGDPLPAVVTVLDNYDAFARSYPEAEDALAEIVREGGNLGLHLILTATSPSRVKGWVSNNVNLAVALQLADRGDYSLAVGRTQGLEPAPLPGRGLVEGTPPLEFQTALPVAGATSPERATALKALVDDLARAWPGPRPRPIATLPQVVPYCGLVPPGDAWPPAPADGSLAVPVGLDVEDLAPFPIDLCDGPHFLITGPVESGKTTFLQTWLLGLAERFPPQRVQLYLVDLRRVGLYPLQGLGHVRAYVEDDDRLGQVLADLEQELRRRRLAQDQARRSGERTWLASEPALVLAIDDADLLGSAAQPASKERLEKMLQERNLGFYVLLAGPVSYLAGAFEGVFRAIKELQTGVLLGTSDHTDLQVLSLRLPPSEAGKSLPAGQGYYTRRGRYRQIKGASCQAGAVTLAEWVARIQRRPAT